MTNSNGSHHMGRRHLRKDYSLPGIYHVTISTNHDLQQPLGRVVGNINTHDGGSDAPRVELTEVGRMVEQELTNAINSHYRMIEVHDHIVMPEHLHAIIEVKTTIVSTNNRQTHLGQVIAGFKKGCNRKYWEITGQRGEPATASSPLSAFPPQGAISQPSAVLPQGVSSLPPAVPPQGFKRPPSNGTTGRPPLFAEGYVDVMPVKESQLELQRQYIHDNPRSRLLRSQNRSQLQPQRRSTPTALSAKALLRYLQQECPPSQIGPKQWQDLQKHLLTTNGMVICDSYGNLDILQHLMLPVVCHRKDAALFQQQREACLAAAANGAVLVSARIAKGEQAIMDEAASKNYPVIHVVDNGFPNIYHPSMEKIDRCLKKRLLQLTPWQYHYRLSDEGISVAECKAMNCVVQALCRKRDDWWKR